MPWKIIADPITPAVSSVENAAAPCLPPTAWPIRGNTYVNTNSSRSGCMIVRPMNIPSSLRTTVMSRMSNAMNADRCLNGGRASVSVATISRATPSR